MLSVVASEARGALSPNPQRIRAWQAAPSESAAGWPAPLAALVVSSQASPPASSFPPPSAALGAWLPRWLDSDSGTGYEPLTFS